jgi:predicted HNH restriction endonuclease
MSSKKLPITVSVADNNREYHRQYRIVNADKIREYNESIPRKRANVLRIRNKKMQLVEYAGSKCARCGIRATMENIECFDFHHIGPKEFTMAPFTISMKRLLEESKNCILVCANCHRMIHREIDNTTLKIS